MPANWQLPTEASQYLDVLAQLKERDVDAMTLSSAAFPTNPPENAVHLSNASSPTVVFHMYQGGVWVPKPIGVAGGGTGTTNLDAFKASLGLGTMAYQNYNTVNITGGNAVGLSAISAAGITAQSSLPVLAFYADTAAVDWKRWQWYAAPAGDLVLSLTNDINSVAANFLAFKRSGISPQYLSVSAYLGVMTTPVMATYAPLQIGGPNPSIATVQDGGVYGVNLYIYDIWRHLSNGYGGMLRFLSGIAEIYVAGNNVGGATAPASITHMASFGVGSIIFTQPSTFYSTVTMNNSLLVDMLIDIKQNNASAGLYLNQSASAWPGIIFRGSGGDFYHILSSGKDTLNLQTSVGHIFQFNGSTFWGATDNTYQLGSAYNRWANIYGIYFRSYTGTGFIFDDTASRGMIRIGGSLMVIDDQGLNLRVGAADFLTGVTYAPFGALTTQSIHLLPKLNVTYWLGYDPSRWYGVYLKDGVYHGSDERDKDILGPERLGLRFINLLDPIEYKWKRVPEFATNRIKHGLSAQRVMKVLDALDIDFQGVQEPQVKEGGSYSIDYAQFIAPIIKAIQELDDKIEALQEIRNA